VLGVPVLPVSGVPFSLGVKAPSLDFLHDFFGTRPQGEEKSHSQIRVVPPSFDIEAAFAELMSSMGALQWEVNLIGERVEQSQIDIRECLKYHHPKLNDDDDDD
jgi:hypothetical protein